MTDTLWTPQDLRDYLRITADSTFYKVKKTFPRVLALYGKYRPTVTQMIRSARKAEKQG